MTDLSAAVADRSDKFEFVHQPGGRLWVKAPVDDKGRSVCPDLHLDLARAEDLGYLLLQAVEEAVARNLDIEGVDP
jgi:hypothetical protein